MAEIGGIYLNFGLWAISLYPGWLVVRQIGQGLGDKKVHDETKEQDTPEAESD